MPAKGRPSRNGQRESSDFVRRAAGRGEGLAAVPHAFLKQRALGLMKQPMRTDLFRPAFQPHELEEIFVPRSYNFVEAGGPVEPVVRTEEPPARAPKRRRNDDKRIEPRIDSQAEEMEAFDPEDVDLDLPPARRPLEANEKLDLPDLEEYDGSDLFDQDDPDAAAEPVIPAEERTELPSSLRNRRSYYEKSDQARKSKLLGGIMPGSGRPAARPGPKRR